MLLLPAQFLLLLCLSLQHVHVQAIQHLGGDAKASRSFLFSPKIDVKPQLIVIAGCTGTGKSTFGMSVALSQSILKCVSTDTIREVTRTINLNSPDPSKPPALFRSSYEGDGDPVADWRDSCNVLSPGIDALVRDAMKRGTSLVLEGVHIQPDRESALLEDWRKQGGTALGVLLMIKDAEAHRSLIFKRGEVTRKGEEKKINAFARIRKIQEAMFKSAVANDWLLIEQKVEPSPLEVVTSLLSRDARDGETPGSE